MHRVLCPQLQPDAATLTLSGPEAHHAVRVKRLETGAALEILNGAGLIAFGTVANTFKSGGEWGMEIAITSSRVVPRVTPRVEMWTATPKGPRLEEMIEGLSEIGVASWHPLETERGVVDPRPGKLSRLDRTSAEASKQCGRAWPLEVAAGGSLALALRFPGLIIACDARGETMRGVSEMAAVRVLVGPEGGWSPRERDLLASSAARMQRCGPHIMRIETAAVAAAAVLLSSASASS